MRPAHDEFQSDDEREEFGSRSLFAVGWIKAVVGMAVLAVVVMLSMPYLVRWLGRPTSPTATVTPAEPTRSAPTSPAPVPAPSATAPVPASPVVVPPAPPKPSAVPAKKSAPAPRAVVDRSGPVPSPRPRATDKVPSPPVVRASLGAADEPAKRPAAAGAVKPQTSATSGAYWIQLGVFKDQRKADALASTLRSDGVPTQVARVARGTNQGSAAVQQHELLVTGASVDKVNKALKGQGRAQAAAGGVSIAPAFSLSDAMAVSKRLSEQGFNVIIRPAGDLVLSGGSEGIVYVVRAGGYPDRGAALAARDALGGKGVGGGIVTQGPAK